MAHNEIHVDAAPAQVFDVLADPRSYARWVVGSRTIRRADPDWPAPGSAFDHAVGIGPLTVKDSSRVERCERPRLLRLLVMVEPISSAHVTLTLDQAPGGGTRITMDEYAADTRSCLFFNRFTDPFVGLRNKESLRRLKALAERREPVPSGPLPARGEPEEGDVQGSSKPAPPA
jgi:hypothetical protein